MVTEEEIQKVKKFLEAENKGSEKNGSDAVLQRISTKSTFKRPSDEDILIIPTLSRVDIVPSISRNRNVRRHFKGD